MKRQISKRGGMTLVEVMVSLVVLIVASSATLASLSAFAGLSHSQEQTQVAWNAIQRQVEDLHANNFAEVLALFDDQDGNDPDGPGTAPGNGFVVAGLDVANDDADGFVGEIVFPQASASSGQLFENYVDAGFGMPRDLNGDGVIDADDHAGDYGVLPTLVRIRWRSRTGVRLIEQQVLLLR